MRLKLSPVPPEEVPVGIIAAGTVGSTIILFIFLLVLVLIFYRQRKGSESLLQQTVPYWTGCPGRCPQRPVSPKVGGSFMQRFTPPEPGCKHVYSCSKVGLFNVAVNEDLRPLRPLAATGGTASVCTSTGRSWRLLPRLRLGLGVVLSFSPEKNTELVHCFSTSACGVFVVVVVVFQLHFSSMYPIYEM